MYKSLLTMQQLRIICGSLKKQQFQILTATSKSNGYTITDLRNYSSFMFGISPNIATQHLRLYSNITPHLSKQKDGKQFIISETEEVNYEFNDTEDGELLAQSFNFKQLLYTQEDDIIKKLNSCKSIEEIKSILVDTDKSHLHKQHIVQSLILIWMLNKLNSSVSGINDQCIINNILILLKDHVPKLNIMELSTCYLYFRKFGIENSEPVLQQILLTALDEIENSNSIIELPALSRLLSGINVGKDFFIPMVCANFIRHIHHHIEQCKNEESARLIAICLSHLQVLISDKMIGLYKLKITDLVNSGEISSSTTKTAVEILNLLNKPVWCHQNLPLIRKLLLILRNSFKQMKENDVKNICRIYQYHMEPVSIHVSLAESMEDILSSKITAENLACLVPFAQPQRRETLVNAFKALISSPDCWQTKNADGNMFSTLRALKISDKKICNTFWNNVTVELETFPEDEVQLRFLRHCFRYMNFNNNLGGTYRHIELEKKLSQMCMSAIEHDIAGRIPQTFARLAAFVFAYGHTPYSWKKYPNILLSKIITMGEQFSPMDCYIISRGLHISLELRYRYEMPRLIGMQLSTIDSILTANVEKHLNDEKLTVTDLNMLVRSLSNRKSLKNSVIYHKTLQKYKDIQCKDLNSRIIKDICYNFAATNYLVPDILEKMFSYIENHHEHVMGETVEKILSCTYNLGYTPQSNDVLHYAGLILLRDFDYMSGLALVQAALALCFYKTIPEELINKVFCVKFIQRVEEEIHLCYSKATYPERVLNTVMQLNRSVCLDFPEANVPWFQQNFINAQISKKQVFETSFSHDVKSLLTALVNNESYIRCNHTTPYGYQIDFVINFDENKNPMKAPAETTMLDRITKVAILLLKLDSFCENDLNALKGPQSLKIKHLEMMGYKVLHINEHDWNSKYMNAPGAKRNYLKCLLQISN